MEVHLTPDLEKQLVDIAAKAGCTADDLAQDAIAGYVADLSDVRGMLDSRYDDLKSGRVRSIPGDKIEAYFLEKSAAARRSQPGS